MTAFWIVLGVLVAFLLLWFWTSWREAGDGYNETTDWVRRASEGDEE